MGQIRQVLSCQQTFRGVFYLWYLIRNYGYKTIKLQNLLFLWELLGLGRFWSVKFWKFKEERATKME